MKVNEEHRNRR